MFREFDFQLDTIKKFVNSVLSDRKKKEYLILGVLILLIAVLTGKNLIDQNSVANRMLMSSDYSEDENESSVPVTDIYVDISGEVMNPGVYRVKSDSRLFEVIKLANGLTDEADVDSINQAEFVFDGQKIIVSKKYDEMASVQQGNASGKISINTADIETLKKLPGIGQTKAQRIIDYRTQNGRFKKIEDIKNVSGIGETTYQTIKDLICL
ncbi:MAG: helix-hairpin-helix domain-containing protein [Clostridia bacterium]|nr:helix-hairpin-helix domain-containing protein [Clostridia bacterium]